jgi:sulfur carrier protein
VLKPDTATIILNGAAHPLEDGQTVAELVGKQTGRQITAAGRAADGRRLGIAVARNAEVVPRSQWSTTVLMADDDIEIVTAAQGG